LIFNGKRPVTTWLKKTSTETQSLNETNRIGGVMLACSPQLR